MAVLSSSFILDNYITCNLFSPFKTLWDSYKYTPMDFILNKNDYNIISGENFIEKHINELDNIMYYEGNVYKLANGIYIEIKNETCIFNILDMKASSQSELDKALKLIFSKMLNIARNNHITLLDAFICINFYFIWNSKNNRSDTTSDTFNKLDDEINSLINLVCDETINTIYRRHSFYIDNLYQTSKTLSNSLRHASSKDRPINYILNNVDLINKVKEIINLNLIVISQKLLFDNNYIIEYIDNDCNSRKLNFTGFDNDIVINIFYLLYTNDIDLIRLLFTDILEQDRFEINLDIFLKLISNQTVFSKYLNRNNINKLKFKYTHLFNNKSEHVYSLSEFQDKYGHSKIVDDNKINSENNIKQKDVKETKDNPFFIINHQYYIERDSFNKDYKRKYKCINVLNKINGDKVNIVIMKCISGPLSANYTLNEYDCKYLGIKYSKNLEVFSSEGIKWVKCSNNKKLYK